MSAEGQCPECAYSLRGLTTPRCPECGVELHPRLLAEPRLAIPRPAWERRPRVSRSYAVWRTFWDITRHPRRFFTGMQYADRLGQAISWYALVLVIASAAHSVITFLVALFSAGNAGFAIGGLRLGAIVSISTLMNARFRFAIIVLPLVLALLIADVALWHDRDRFRLFAKALLYSQTTCLWFMALLIGGKCLTTVIGHVGGRGPLGITSADPNFPWPNVLLAATLTWQYMLVMVALGGSRFAILQPSRPRVRVTLMFLIIAAWGLCIYLTLFDCLLGWRFSTGMWGRFGL